jgi:hypothetical protein
MKPHHRAIEARAVTVRQRIEDRLGVRVQRFCLLAAIQADQIFSARHLRPRHLQAIRHGVVEGGHELHGERVGGLDLRQRAGTAEFGNLVE